MVAVAAPALPAAALRLLERAATARSLGLAARRHRIPRQQPPTLIESDYAAALIALVQRLRALAQPLFDELPVLLRSDAENTRHDVDTMRVGRVLDRVQEDMARALNTTQLEALTERMARGVADHQKRQIARQAKAALGVDIALLDPTVPATMRGFVAENVTLIKGLASDTANKIAQAVTRAAATGTRAEDLAKELQERFAMSERRARLIARDQIGKINSQVRVARNRELGLTRFTWTTARDERVRGDPKGKYPRAVPSHFARHGKVYSYDDPPTGRNGKPELPGMPVLCRCIDEPVWDDLTGALPAPKRPRKPAAPKLEPPAGFDAQKRAVKAGLPTRSKIAERAAYRVPISALQGRLIALPGAGKDAQRVQSIRNAWQDGKRLPPIQLLMLPDGRLFVDDGRHRLIAALESGREVLVTVGRAAAGTAEGTVPL